MLHLRSVRQCISRVACALASDGLNKRACMNLDEPGWRAAFTELSRDHVKRNVKKNQHVSHLLSADLSVNGDNGLSVRAGSFPLLSIDEFQEERNFQGQGVEYLISLSTLVTCDAFVFFNKLVGDLF